MLVLTRKQKECIKIGESITITILRVQGQSVRVGIDAPREVRVMRGELAPQAEAKLSVDVSVADPADEPQIVQFRFSPEALEAEPVELSRSNRGPLAALMATRGSVR